MSGAFLYSIKTQNDNNYYVINGRKLYEHTYQNTRYLYKKRGLLISIIRLFRYIFKIMHLGYSHPSNQSVGSYCLLWVIPTEINNKEGQYERSNRI